MSESRLLMVLCSSRQIAGVRALIEEHGVRGYTEIPQVLGAGLTGRHLGTRAFPGSGSMIFTVIDRGRSDELASALARLAASCAPGEGVKAFELEVREVV